MSPQYIASQYESLRRVKGDGNCFLRAFAYGLFHYMQQAPADQSQQVADYIRESKDKLVAEGFSEYIEDFWEGAYLPLLILQELVQHWI